MITPLSTHPPRTTPVTHRLDNGLRLTVAPDHSAPVAGVAVHYGVGFRSEPEGRSGFAHLFEHLMFQGGADMPLDHFRQVESVGGVCNASTRQDYTDFYDVVPADGLAHVLALEASRMRAPKITTQAIRAQAAVVAEEVLSKTQRPYGGFPWPLLTPVLFRSFANAHDGYGDHVALREVTVDDCEDFFARYYGPDNAVLTVTGDVHVDRTIELVEQSFAAIPPRSAEVPPSWWEPEPDHRIQANRHDAFAALPAVAIGYRVPDPAAGKQAHVALSALADILVGGTRPRLERKMQDAGCATGPLSARCGLFDFLDARDPELFVFTAVHQSATTADQVIDVLDADLRLLAADGPPAVDLQRVCARKVNAHHRGLDQVVNRVRELGRFVLLFDDAGLAGTLPDRFARLTAADIAAAAARLAVDARAVLTLTPATPDGRP